MRALTDLKSRFHRLELEVESESSLSSSVKLQCPKLEYKLGWVINGDGGYLRGFSEIGWEKDAWDIDGEGWPLLLLHQLWWEVRPFISTDVWSCTFSGLKDRGEATREMHCWECESATLLTAIGEIAHMKVAAGHSGTFSISLSPLKTWATSAFYGVGLDSEGCEAVNSLGKDCGPLKMAFSVSQNMWMQMGHVQAGFLEHGCLWRIRPQAPRKLSPTRWACRQWASVQGSWRNSKNCGLGKSQG